MTVQDLDIITNQAPYPILLEWSEVDFTIRVLGFEKFKETTIDYIERYKPAWVCAEYKFIDSSSSVDLETLLEYKE